MPKLRNLSGEQVIKILIANGFIQVRQKDSHVMLRKEIDSDNKIPANSSTASFACWRRHYLFYQGAY